MSADAVTRFSPVAAIPIVAPSKRRPHASHADGPPTELAFADDRAAEDAGAAAEPEIPRPVAETPTNEAALGAPAALPAPWPEDETGDKDDNVGGQSASIAIDVPPASETEPAAVVATPESSPVEDAQAAPIAEELLWSSPREAAAHAGSVFDGPPQLIALAGEEEQPRASQLALATTQEPVPVEAVAAIPDQAVWTMTAASAPPADAAPSSAEHTARDLIPYLRLAGQVAGAGAATLAVILLLLVVAYRWVDPPSTTLILGQRLAGTEIDQTWVPLERISPNLVRAVILSEDGGFCRHRGVDWAALGEAIESDRGGSTITMQVVKNLFLWPSRSYVRKAMEMALAYLVEIVWPKHRVLELYLNIAEWGPGIFGAEAAAQYHFGKPAARLTAQEAALLAVALPNPLEREAWHPGYLHKRLADNLLTRMRAVRTAMRCVQPPRSGG